MTDYNLHSVTLFGKLSSYIQKAMRRTQKP